MSKHWKWDEIGLLWEDTLQCICVNLRILGSWLFLLLVVVRARILRVFLHLRAFQLSQKFISSWSFMIFMLLRMISGCFLRIWSISCCSAISSNFSAPKSCLGEQTSSLIGSLADFMDYLWVPSCTFSPQLALSWIVYSISIISLDVHDVSWCHHLYTRHSLELNYPGGE